MPKSVFRQIVKYSKDLMPQEACGYLGGKGYLVKEFYPMKNIDKSGVHFTLDPEEQFAVMDKAHLAGLEIVAVFHSHPESPARMSEEDIRLANDPEVLYLIYSVLNKELRAFYIGKEKKLTEIPISYSI